MKVGDLVRFKKVLNHRTLETTEWCLGVLIEKEYNLCKVLSKTGELISIWAEFVQKAGKKDENRGLSET